MARQHDRTDRDARPTASSVEATIAQRRRLLKRAALLGVPLILTLHGRAHASVGGQDSGQMSGNLSQP